MAGKNLFQDLKDVLQEFKDFLDENVPTIQPAIQALAGIIPQVTELLDQLVDLMNSLKEEINKLDPGAIPGLEEATQFTGQVSNLLESVRNLVPESADEIDAIGDVAEVITGLPSLDEVKSEILALVDAIIVHLNGLKPA